MRFVLTFENEVRAEGPRMRGSALTDCTSRNLGGRH